MRVVGRGVEHRAGGAPDHPPGGGRGAGKRALLSGASIAAIFRPKIFFQFVSSKRGQTTTFPTALDALIPKKVLFNFSGLLVPMSVPCRPSTPVMT